MSLKQRIWFRFLERNLYVFSFFNKGENCLQAEDRTGKLLIFALSFYSFIFIHLVVVFSLQRVTKGPFTQSILLAIVASILGAVSNFPSKLASGDYQAVDLLLRCHCCFERVRILMRESYLAVSHHCLPLPRNPTSFKNEDSCGGL